MEERILAHLEKYKIDDTARLFIMAQLGIESNYPDKEWAKTIMKSMPKNIEAHCVALCLYANLVTTKTLINKTADLKPKYLGNLDDAKNMLKQKGKYSNLNDDELKAKIEEINLIDTRNCFAHGSFTFTCPGMRQGSPNIKKGLFFLNPTHSSITCPHQLVISFQTVYDLVWQYMLDKTDSLLKNARFLSKTNLDIDKHIDEFVIPSSLQALVSPHFPPYMRHPMQKTLSDPNFQSHLQNTLSCAMFALNQNEFYEIFGADSEVFALVKVFRNSWIHSYTHTTENGQKQVVEDPQNSGLPDAIVDDKITVSRIMEMLHAQKLVFSAELNAGNITKEEIRGMSVIDGYNYAFGKANSVVETDTISIEKTDNKTK